LEHYLEGLKIKLRTTVIMIGEDGFGRFNDFERESFVSLSREDYQAVLRKL